MIKNNYFQLVLFFVILLFGNFLIYSGVHATLAPQIYFTELNLSKNTFEPGQTLEGTVSLWNYEEFVISDLVFYFQLLGGEVNGVDTKMIAEQRGEEIFSLSPGQEIKKTFSYTLPSNLPVCSLKFRIQLANSRGEEWGWIDKVISVGGEGKFLTLDNYWVVKEGEDLSPGGGVHYQPGEIPEVRFDVANSSDFTIIAFPKIITYKRNVGGEILQEQAGESIIVEPEGKQTLRITLPELTKPESYLSEIKFLEKDSQQLVSNSLYFRWIISGEDAEILSVQPNKSSYQAGDEAEIKVQYTGPPDYEIEGGEGVLKVEIYDEKENLVGKAEKDIEIESREILIEVPITKSVYNPKVKVEIIKKGRILDQYEFEITPVVKVPEKHLPEEKISFFERNKNLIIGLILIILIIGAIIYFLKTKKMKTAKTLILLTLLGVGILFGNYVLAATEVTGGNCDTNIVFNSPVPNKKYEIGDILNFKGKFRVTSCGNGLFYNRVDFFVTEDKDIPLTLAGDDCCENCRGATSVDYGSCDSIQNLEYCDEVEVLDESGPGIYKLGTIYPSDVHSGARPYWVEYNQSFVIPDNLGFSGPVRFYVQYSGTHWESHWHWDITYQSGEILELNHSPEADFSCSIPGCYAYAGTSNPILTLENNSTDPDGQDDIVKSEWEILDQGWANFECTGNNSICDFSIPSTFSSSGEYDVKLTVTDNAGETDSEEKTITIRDDIDADFLCSLSGEEGDWHECDLFKGVQEEYTYFKDISTPSEEASSISSWAWEINDVPFSGNVSTSSVKISGKSNTVKLKVTDNKGRTGYASHIFDAKLPLPTWQEIGF